LPVTESEEKTFAPSKSIKSSIPHSHPPPAVQPTFPQHAVHERALILPPLHQLLLYNQPTHRNIDPSTMATQTPAIPVNPSAHHVAALLPKLQDVDPDIRYMSLNDLNQMLTIGHPTFISHDYTCCARVVEGLLHTLNDQNGDVQNMAIKCLGPFVNKAPESILCPTFDKVSNLRTDNAVDSSVPALAVRAMVVALPRPAPAVPRTAKVQEAYSAVSRALIPRLVGYTVIQTGKNLPAPPKGMIQVEMENGIDSNALDVLVEVGRCFGPMLQEVEVEALQKITTEVLENPRCSTVMKKKAVTALSVLSPYFSDALLASVV